MIVDLFMNMFFINVNCWINLIFEMLMVLVLIVMIWKLWDGMVNKYEYGDIIFILEMFVWWFYLVCFIVLVFVCVIVVYFIFVRVVEVFIKIIIIFGLGVVY